MSSYLVSESWQSEHTQLRFVADSINDGTITLFLGAGASAGFNLPSWSGLIDNLLLLSSIKRVDVDDIKEARRIRRVHFSDIDIDFNKSLHKALYKDYKSDFESIRGNNTLASIFSILSSIKGNQSLVVITLNYDDVLERYLRFHGLKVQSLYENDIKKKQADVYVYHPHGFLPYNMDLSDARFMQKIVIDSKDYIQKISNPKDPWYSLVIERLFTTTPIFIGIGINDLNLSNFLQTVKQYRVGKKEPYYGLAFVKCPDEMDANYWEDEDIFCKSIENYKDSIAKFLFSACQLAADDR